MNFYDVHSLFCHHFGVVQTNLHKIGIKVQEPVFWVYDNLTPDLLRYVWSQANPELNKFRGVDWFSMSDEEVEDFHFKHTECEGGHSFVFRNYNEEVWEITKWFLSETSFSTKKITSHMVRNDYHDGEYTSLDVSSQSISKGGWGVEKVKREKFCRTTSILPVHLEGIVNKNLWGKLPYNIKKKVVKLDRAGDITKVVFGYKSPIAIKELNFLPFNLTFKQYRDAVQYQCRTGDNFETKSYSDFALYRDACTLYEYSNYVPDHMKGNRNPFEKALWKYLSSTQERTRYITYLLDFRAANTDPEFMYKPLNNSVLTLKASRTQHNLDAKEWGEFKEEKNKYLLPLTYKMYKDTFLVGNYEVYTPTSVSDVKQWGWNHNHCLAGYTSAHGKDGLIYGVKNLESGGQEWEVYAKGKVTPTASKGHFQGYNNSSPPDEVRKLILEGIKKSSSWKLFASKV